MKTKFHLYLSIFAISAFLVIPTITFAATTSPFIGHWQAIDVDGSDIRLSIAGPPQGPFKITWTESYISFCDREPGIVRGVGWLNEGDSNLLEADLHVECFTTGATLDFQLTFRYHPATGTLSSRYPTGQILIWHRPGGGQVEEPPALSLRVNYGHDWVESFYEGGHMAWVTLTESDGVTVKGTIEMVTEAKDYWGGETGFVTNDSVWLDGDGNPMDYPPDIQPYDWVYGWVDNGASAQVQIGDISGTIDLDADSISGKITAPWFSNEVNVECHPWGAPEPVEMKIDTILPDGNDTYSCSWAEEWDIQPGQDVGVGYFGEDGHWVANAFFIPNTRFTVWPEWNYLEGYEWPDDAVVSISVTGKEVCTTEAVSGYPEWDPSNTFFSVNFPEGCVIEVGDLIILSFESLSLTHQIPALAITDVNLDLNMVAGTAVFDAEQYNLHTWIHGIDGSYMQLSAEGGTWLADFGSLGFDLQPGMGGRVELVDQASNATAVEWNIPNPHFTVFPEWEWFDGMDWPDGALVDITVEGKLECSTEGVSSENFFNGGFPEDCDVVIGDKVTFTDGVTIRTHTIQNLTITAVDKGANTVAGTADTGALVYAWVHEYGYEMQLMVEDGTWLADFGSAGLDLVENMGGRAEIRDEFGNGTAVDWWIPNPHFTIFPEWEWFDGYDWPDGATVTITVEGKEVCNTEGVSSENFFNGGFPEGCDIVIGDTVTFTDGVTDRTHEVRNLAISVVDADANTVAGIADDGEVVYAWVHEFGYDMQMTVEGGTWLADFGSLGFDLLEGMCGRAEIRDEFGNATAVDWCIPNPVIFAHPAYEAIEGTGWTPGDEVTISVDDPTNGAGVDYSDAQIVGDDAWVHFSLHDFDLQAGNIITMTDGLHTRTMVVSNLRVTGFNLDGQTVSGVGDPGSEVLIADNGMVVPVDEDGNWSATLAELLPGTWWTVIHAYSDDGNEVRETFRVPEPQISAHPAYNFIEGHEWTPGGEVTVMIDDPANGESVDYTQTAIASENINYLYDTRVQFALAFDLKAGDKVTMTDGQYTQTMIVSSLKVTDFNLSAQTVYGVGDPGSEVLIADNGMIVPVDGDGNWSATLADLLPGSWWTVVHVYPDINQTVETFRAPAPGFYVTPEEDEIFAAEWTPGQTLEVYVNDVLIASQTVPDVGSYYGPEVMFELPVDLLPGDLVTLTDGRWTKELIVANLQVTGFDLSGPIMIYGTANPGPLFIGVSGSEMWLEVGEDGMWSVSLPGSAPGDWGSVIQWDQDGDQTRDIFMIPYP